MKQYKILTVFIIYFFSITIGTLPLYPVSQVILDEKTRSIPIGKKILIFEDMKGEETINSMIKRENSSFVPCKKENPVFGFTSSVYWVKFETLGKTAQTKQWFMEVSYPVLDDMELFHVRNNRVIKKERLGSKFHFNERPIKYRNFLFSLLPPAGEKTVFFLRIKTTSSMNIPLTVWSQAGLYNKMNNELLILGIFYGIMLVMALYNLFLAISLRDLNYLYYVFWILTSTMVPLTLNGLSFQYLWPRSLWWAKVNLPFFMCFGGFWGVLFGRIFLDTKNRLHRFDIVLLILQVLCGLITVLSLVTPYFSIIRFATLLWILIPILMFAASIISLKDGFNPARYFLIAWASAFAGTLMYALKSLGIVPAGLITNWGLQIGLAAEVILLSLGLGDRINELKKERERAQNLLLETKTNLVNSFARFVPRQFLNYLEHDSIEEIHLGDAAVVKQMTILFTDIRNFTTLSEKLTVTENFRFLNSYLKRMEPVIVKYQGFVDKFIGDAIMALFPSSTQDALQAAVDMQKELTIYNSHRAKMGYQQVVTGIGLHTGELMLGTVGSKDRLDTTVIGDSVNLASRIEGLNKIYNTSLLITDESLALLTDKSLFMMREIDTVQVAGKHNTVTIYEIYNTNPDRVIEQKQITLNYFKEGIGLYKEGKFKEARRTFRKCIKIAPADTVPPLYIERCNYLIRYKPGKKWNGISKLTTK